MNTIDEKRECFAIMNLLCSLTNIKLDSSQRVLLYEGYVRALGSELTLKALRLILDEGFIRFPLTNDLKKILSKSFHLKKNVPEIVHQIQMLAQSKGSNWYAEARNEAQKMKILWAFDKIFTPPSYYRTYCEAVKDDQWTIYTAQWNKILSGAYEEWAENELSRHIEQARLGIEYKPAEQISQSPKRPPPSDEAPSTTIQPLLEKIGKPMD